MVFGVNVASSEDPLCDDYVIEHLREADVQHVRMAWSVNSAGKYPERFLNRLLDEGLDVMIALVPDPKAAARIADDEACAQRWRTLVRTFLEGYASRVQIIEIGNAPNRPSWSGYSPRGYIAAWQIAAEEAQAFDVVLAGPNISDFEPFFNIAYLKAMQRNGARVNIQTDNLFVERSVQPEADDPSAMGKSLSRLVRLNLTKKINILVHIGNALGVSRSFCTYTCWTSRRLDRWSTHPQRKGADYLARYLVICAVNGKLERVYWGPLIDRRDGLIDCGDIDYPAVDNVACYEKVRGRVQNFEPTISFYTFKFITGLLKTSRCSQASAQTGGINHAIFEDAEFEHHVMWAPDRMTYDLSALYPGDTLASALARTAAGVEMAASTHSNTIRESPLVLSWPLHGKAVRPSEEQIRKLQPVGAKNLLNGLDYDTHLVPIESARWRGAVNLRRGQARTLAQGLLPDQLRALPVINVLRDKRNKLWTVASPLDNKLLVVKQNRAKGIKRFSYLFRDSKGLRHHNNATEMLRRGINTPRPVAYTEQHNRSGVAENYYVSEFVAGAFSTRDLFAAFKEGAHSFRGLDRRTWLEHIARFVAYMHKRRVVHRDLSSGNLLITMVDGVPNIAAIDIGRATIDRDRGYDADIKRICYKLNWSDRETFVSVYRDALPYRKLRFWRLLLYSYDAKLQLKRLVKGNLSIRDAFGKRVH